MATDTIRLGVIGIDTSHFARFTKQINQLNSEGRTRCRVTAFWTDGRQDAADPHRVEGWRQEILDTGVKQARALESLLDEIDGAMVLSVNGNKHRDQVMPVLERGLRTFIDKPLAANLRDARAILDAARKHNTPCYSASSLRFADEIGRLDREKLGPLVAIDAFGPGSISPHMPGLFFYGVHAVEMIDGIWGPGARRVSAYSTQDRDLVDVDYGDGRYARMRIERSGKYVFGATVHGKNDVQQFVVSGDLYAPLLDGMIRFFEGGPAPASLRDLVENVAVMEAGNDSMAKEGAWVDVPRID